MSYTFIFDADQGNFEEKVLKLSDEIPVVVDFHAEWCGPCKMLGPVLEKLVAERNGEIALAKVDTDRSPDLAQYFGIESIPAVKAIRDRRVVLEFNGVMPEAELNRFLDQISPSTADKMTKEAAGLEESDPEKAEAIYRKAMEEEPHHQWARVGLARVLLGQNRKEEIESLLEAVGTEGEVGAEAQRIQGLLNLDQIETGGEDEATLRSRIEANPKDAQARYELGCKLGQDGKHEEALEMLLSAAELDYELAGGKVREAMVQIFYSLGSNHPLSDQYRGKLAQLLY